MQHIMLPGSILWHVTQIICKFNTSETYSLHRQATLGLPSLLFAAFKLRS